jgi:hypothetical protein
MTMNNELEGLGRKQSWPDVGYYYPGTDTDKIHKEPQSGQLMPWLRFKPGTSHTNQKHYRLRHLTQSHSSSMWHLNSDLKLFKYMLNMLSSGT